MSSVHAILVHALGACALLGACVGDAPDTSSNTPPIDGGGSSSGTTGSTSSTSSSSTSSSGGSSGSTSSSGTIDAAVDVVSLPDADAGTPQPTCTTPPLLSGAFNFLCRASEDPIAAPGGTIPVGDYHLVGFWRAGGCGATEKYHIGWMTVFAENGATFMRYSITSKGGAGDTGTTVTGTWSLVAGASGALVREEMCDPATKGTTQTGGKYGVSVTSPTEIVIRVGDYEEFWKKPQ